MILLVCVFVLYNIVVYDIILYSSYFILFRTLYEIVLCCSILQYFILLFKLYILLYNYILYNVIVYCSI